MAISDRGFGESEAPRPLVGAVTQLEVQDLVAGGWHTLRLSGELDLVSSTLLDDAIGRIAMSAIAGVALDLRNVTFIDSTGVRAVVELHDRCRRQRIEFRVISGSAAVQRIFEVTGLLDVLPFQTDGITTTSD